MSFNWISSTFFWCIQKGHNIFVSVKLRRILKKGKFMFHITIIKPICWILDSIIQIDIPEAITLIPGEIYHVVIHLVIEGVPTYKPLLLKHH